MLQLIKNLFLLNGVLAKKVKGASLYMEATALHGAKEYRAALPIMTQAADMGETDAMTVLGTMHLLGQGCQADGALAVSWLQRAVDAGYEGAVSILGMAYATGKGGASVDLLKARPLLERAAAAGDEQSDRMLRMIDNGEGMFAKRRGQHQRR